jgi:hypothetical protein
VTSEPFAIDAVATRPSSASRSSGPYSEAMTARSASMRAVRTESAAITVPGTTSSAATKTARESSAERSTDNVNTTPSNPATSITT